MSNVIKIVGVFLMAASLAATIAPQAQAQEQPDITGGLSWGHYSETEHAALIWTPTQLFKARDAALPSVQEVTEGAVGPISISDVMGVAWEPWIDWVVTPSALIWTRSNVYKNLNYSYIAEEVTVNPGGVTISGTRGIVWANWVLPQGFTGPWALIWTDTQLFSYNHIDGAQEALVVPGGEPISGIRGIVWEEWDPPIGWNGPTALIWTDTQLFSYNPITGTAEVMVNPGGESVSEVQGIAWEYWPSLAANGALALIWTTEHLYFFIHANPTEVSEVTQGINEDPIPDILGIVWQDYDPEQTSKALIWTKGDVTHIGRLLSYSHNTPYTTTEVTEDGGSISGIKGISWEPWEGSVGNPFPNATEALIWTSNKLLQHYSFNNTASEVLEGGASISGVRGVSWEPYAYDGAYMTEALIWTTYRVLSHTIILTSEVQMDGNSIEDVRGIAWEYWDGDVQNGATPEALIWTPTQIFHHTSNRLLDGEVLEHETENSIGDVQGAVWEAYDNGATHTALIWTPGMVFRYPWVNFTAQEVTDDEDSIYSYDPTEMDLVRVMIHQAGYHNFDGLQTGLRTGQSGAGSVGNPGYTPVSFAGSASGAVAVPISEFASPHATVLGGAPYLNTSLIFGPVRVAGVVSGNAMCLYAFRDPAGMDEDPGPSNERAAGWDQNYPNPFNPTTTIAYTLPVAGRVDLRILDVSGRLIRVLRDHVRESPGRHEVLWDGRDTFGRKASSGIYYYSLTVGDDVETKPMILLR